jgi:hypothetical protein
VDGIDHLADERDDFVAFNRDIGRATKRGKDRFIDKADNLMRKQPKAFDLATALTIRSRSSSL